MSALRLSPNFKQYGLTNELVPGEDVVFSSGVPEFDGVQHFFDTGDRDLRSYVWLSAADDSGRFGFVNLTDVEVSS